MKRLFCISSLVFFFISSWGQQKFSFADRWQVYTYNEGLGPDARLVEHNYFAGGDTVFSGIKYTKINLRNHYYCAIRYSADSLQMFYNVQGTDYLLCDFSKEVGDTCYLYAGTDDSATTLRNLQRYFVVLAPWKIISKTKESGRIVVTLQCCHPDYKRSIATFVQGIGSKNLFFPFGCTPNLEGGTDIHCANVYSGDSLIYAFDLSRFWFMNLQRTFCQNGKQWNVAYEFDNSMDHTHSITTWQLRLSGDTLVNGWTYHRLLGQEKLLCLVREDPTTKEVYRLSLNDGSKEQVWFRFGLSVGDTVVAYDPILQKMLPHVTVAVDSSQTYPCYKMKILDKIKNQDVTYWMEGVGSLDGRGFFPYLNRVGYKGSFLLCASQEDNMLYQSNLGEANDCNINIVEKKTNLSEDESARCATKHQRKTCHSSCRRHMRYCPKCRKCQGGKK